MNNNYINAAQDTFIFRTLGTSYGT